MVYLLNEAPRARGKIALAHSERVFAGTCACPCLSAPRSKTLARLLPVRLYVLLPGAPQQEGSAAAAHTGSCACLLPASPQRTPASPLTVDRLACHMQTTICRQPHLICRRPWPA